MRFHCVAGSIPQIGVPKNAYEPISIRCGTLFNAVYDCVVRVCKFVCLTNSAVTNYAVDQICSL